MKLSKKDLIEATELADAIITAQREYILELEQKVEDLQTSLDAVLVNKCRTRKVKVKYIGRF